MKKHALFPIFILVFLILATTLVVLYAKGFRLSFKQDVPQLSKTGLLVAESVPNGAQVFIDDHLTTATDNTITLSPGTYEIKIQKDGYFPWQKRLQIREEVVTKAEARLLPLAPKLESIATTPVENPLLDPSGTKIAYQIASESAVRKNGIFVLNMSATNIPVPILTLQSSSTQIADNTSDLFSQASLEWSPDGTEILARIGESPENSSFYLLESNRFNESPQDVTAILQSIYAEWDLQKQQKIRNLRSGLKADVRNLIDENFSIIAWSPDETKILYQASTSAQLPIIITPRRIGTNTLAEARNIKVGEVYVYDAKEDINMRLPVVLPEECEPIPGEILEPFKNCRLPITWMKDSKHLVYINDKKVIVMDEDGSNNITIYAGPFVDNFAVPWPDSSRIVILTNLNNPTVSPTLYTLGLK